MIIDDPRSALHKKTGGAFLQPRTLHTIADNESIRAIRRLYNVGRLIRYDSVSTD